MMLRAALLVAVLSSTRVIPSAAKDLHSQEAPVVLDALPGSTLTIRGSTSVGAPWHCVAYSVTARVAVMPGAQTDSTTLPDVRGIALHVPVGSMKCQSGLMERQMRKTIRADVDTAAQYINGRFDIQDDSRPPHENQRFLYGPIKVAGAERNIFFNVTIDRLADGTLHAKSRVPLALTEFGMVPPRVLFGIVRARDAVVVEVDLRYRDPR
jgi:hypothetical protein